jgi:hypothetical protein
MNVATSGRTLEPRCRQSRGERENRFPNLDRFGIVLARRSGRRSLNRLD